MRGKTQKYQKHKHTKNSIPSFSMLRALSKYLNSFLNKFNNLISSPISSPVSKGVRFAQPLLFFQMFCKPLFVFPVFVFTLAHRVLFDLFVFNVSLRVISRLCLFVRQSQMLRLLHVLCVTQYEHQFAPENDINKILLIAQSQVIKSRNHIVSKNAILYFVLLKRQTTKGEKSKLQLTN